MYIQSRCYAYKYSFVIKIHRKGYGTYFRVTNEKKMFSLRIQNRDTKEFWIGKIERDNPFFHGRSGTRERVTCVPRVFLNTVYGYHEISVGVYRISPTDRSRFYVTDRGHSRKERSSFSLFLQSFFASSLYIPSYRIYCRPIATDNNLPRLAVVFPTALFPFLSLCFSSLFSVCATIVVGSRNNIIIFFFYKISAMQ